MGPSMELAAEAYGLRVVEKRMHDVLCALLGNDWKQHERERVGKDAAGEEEEEDVWWCESDGEDYAVVLVWKVILEERV
jgi:hypothetical protein